MLYGTSGIIDSFLDYYMHLILEFSVQTMRCGAVIPARSAYAVHFYAHRRLFPLPLPTEFVRVCVYKSEVELLLLLL